MAAFAAVYLIWGSSFVATKVMVAEVPAMLAVAIRGTLAGGILFGIASWLGYSLPESRREWRHILFMAVMTVVLSTMLNVVAARHIASNEQALLNASSAFFIVIFGSIGGTGTELGKRAWGSIVLGFGGVALLLLPRGDGHESPLLWMLVVLAACIAWGIGTAYFRRYPPSTEPLMFNALQLGSGGLMLIPMSLMAGEELPVHWSTSTVVALIFLTLFSSCIGYTAFTYLMPRVSPAKLGTYAYVNPLVATLVGWWLLGEALTPIQWVGGIIVLASVAVINLPGNGNGNSNGNGNGNGQSKSKTKTSRQ